MPHHLQEKLQGKKDPKRINWGLKRHHAMNSWTIGQIIFQNCLGSSNFNALKMLSLVSKHKS